MITHRFENSLYLLNIKNKTSHTGWLCPQIPCSWIYIPLQSVINLLNIYYLLCVCVHVCVCVCVCVCVSVFDKMLQQSLFIASELCFSQSRQLLCSQCIHAFLQCEVDIQNSQAIVHVQPIVHCNGRKNNAPSCIIRQLAKCSMKRK